MLPNAERLWFAPVIEGLFRIRLRTKWTSSFLARMREVGIDLERELLPAYSAETFTRALKVAAAELYPTLPLDEAMAELGATSWRGFTDTFVGKALVGFMRVLGPRRTLPRAGRNFRSAANFVEVTVKELLPGCFAVAFNDVDEVPFFFKGLMDASGADLGAPRPSDTHVLLQGTALTLFYDINSTPHPAFASLWESPV